jgi:hypothetical protein
MRPPPTVSTPCTQSITENLMNALKSTTRKDIDESGNRSTPNTPVSGGQMLLAMPFDALRAQYASVVKAGLAQRSLLASGHLERTLDAMEKLILGPLARQR